MTTSLFLLVKRGRDFNGIPYFYLILIHRMQKFLIYILVLFLVVGFVEVNAQTTSKYSNEFLSIGVGARAFAMGNANAASVSDETSVYWNPAALTQLDYPINFGIMHAEYFAGLAQYDFGVLAFKPDEKSAFAISLIRFGVDNIPNTTDLIDSDGNIQFDRITAFSVVDYAISLSYARNLEIEGLSVGGNVKIVRRKAGDFAEAWGFGIDLSAVYSHSNLKVAVMLRDISTTFNSWTFHTDEIADVFELTGNIIPQSSTEITLPKIILGASWYQPIYGKFGGLAELNLDISTDGKRNVLIKGDPFSIDPHFGLEFDYNQLIFLRGGINNIQQEDKGYSGDLSTTLQPNIGLGIKYKRIKVDYALTDLGNVSAAGYSHIFSLSYSIKQFKVDKKTK